MVEQDDAVSNVLFQSIARQHALAAFSGDDGGQFLILEPAEQTAELRANQRLVREPGEKHLKRIQHYALGADRPHSTLQADKEALQIVFAGLLDLAALDEHMIDRELAALLKFLQIVPE